MTKDQYFGEDDDESPNRGVFEKQDDSVSSGNGDDDLTSDEGGERSTADSETDVEHADLPPSLDELTDSLDLLTIATERDEYLDALRRLQADFDNYRKRMLRQQSENLDRAAAGLTERLLPVLDAMDLALAHAETDQSGDVAAAFSRIGALLRATLEKEGLERIDTVNVAFDPTIHDAVAHDVNGDEPNNDEDTIDHHGQGLVTEILRAGYRLKGNVLRPAMVKVRS